MFCTERIACNMRARVYYLRKQRKHEKGTINPFKEAHAQNLGLSAHRTVGRFQRNLL